LKRPHSYSSMSLYNKCPKLFEWAYVLGNHKPPGAAATRGVELHAKLEEFFRGGSYPTKDKTLAPWQRYMENLLSYSPVPEEDLAVDSVWGRVGYEDPDAYARGKVDLRYRIGDTVYILDWKSGREYPSHEGQGKMYMALSEPATKYVTEFVYLDQPLHTVPRLYTRADRSCEILELSATIDKINEATEYPATPSHEGCRWCPLSWRQGGPCTKAP